LQRKRTARSGYGLQKKVASLRADGEWNRKAPRRILPGEESAKRVVCRLPDSCFAANRIAANGTSQNSHKILTVNFRLFRAPSIR
jgi:hypothetical protein